MNCELESCLFGIMEVRFWHEFSLSLSLSLFCKIKTEGWMSYFSSRVGALFCTELI